MQGWAWSEDLPATAAWGLTCSEQVPGAASELEYIRGTIHSYLDKRAYKQMRATYYLIFKKYLFMTEWLSTYKWEH